MLLTLTDHLTCPRCGPAAGLILLMEEADDRRVRTGALGCPLCRTRYPVTDRVADLRGEAGAAGTAEEAEEAKEAEERGARTTVDMAAFALRVAALLGLAEGRGFVLMDGRLGLNVALELGRELPEQEMVVPIGAARSAEVSGRDLSALLETGPLPIASRAMRAVAHVGPAPGQERLLELIRVCRPTGRLLVELGPGDEAGRSRALDAVARLLEDTPAEVRARDATGLMAVVL